MKCPVCGFDDKEDKRKYANNEFLKIGGDFFARGKWPNDHPRETYLYVCPQCNTVQASY